MRAFLLIPALAAAAWGARAEDCVLPMSPRVPDGRYASEDDMRRARQDMLSFVSKADDFLHCIDAAQKQDQQTFTALGSKDPGRTEDFKARQQEYAQRYNAGVEAQKGAAAKFNEQLHIWKAHSGQSSTKSG